MTSVSSLGSTLTQYQSPLSSLDKNGDGVISADELAAASQSSTSATASTDSDDSSTDIVKKITADILSLMLSMQKTDGSDDQSDDASKDVFAAMDTDGDGKLTESEFLAADPNSIKTSGDSDPLLTKVLSDMQTALQAYRNTYGASAAAGDSAAEDVAAV
ncbi:EF-hand domain-containing protein [Rhizobium sp. 1AS11]|uniref:EF-hand domain-containing protein n=1 Tax=Rhizobium acaciae TaxID=2989736 RepID=UPI0022206A9C|nr:EF-hand domain-containing protein [Rhizobium acaciae]MCW1409933.1 EF-hand domain-containing protein [Rhizobium acaciae]MCW1742079.1 EF-hand domain-containing protein [Rhizobium acaciae]MCW1753455.1 EF-hand domain-containing protein [Rhizobium acaciae]